MKRKAIAWAGLLLMVLLATCPAEDSFTVTVVDSGFGIGAFASVGVLSDDQVAIAYEAGLGPGAYQLKLAQIDGVDYTIETASDSPDAGIGAILDLSSYDELVAIHGGSQVMVSSKASWADWDTDDIVFRGNAGGPSIGFAMSDRDEPHIAYAGDDGLGYAWYDQPRNEWANMWIHGGSCSQVTLAMNDESPVVGFVHNSNIVVGKLGSLGWSFLPSIEGESPAVGIDSEGNVVVVYVFQGQLCYRVFRSELGWLSPVVLDDGLLGTIGVHSSGPKLGFDSAAHAHIVYCRGNELIYMTDRGSWTPVLVDSAEPSPPMYLSLAFDSENRPLIAFFDLDGVPGDWRLKLAGFDLPRPDRCDFNIDGIINLVDFAPVARMWGLPVPVGDPLDVNGDQVVDSIELTALAEGWLWRRYYVD